ncbi:MAG: hypothetical protein JRG76_03720 [Deltaproteobacteria bacterium]|nr:hypothetical protein [Deltaproteobacteria bacterium]MBW2413598.1 hypothetical protein [Deltaproteobacteria bacterium]
MPENETVRLPGAPAEDASGPALLRLARSSRAAGRRALQRLSVGQQAEACRELRPEVRSEFLMLCDYPEQVVPLLPEAEVAISIRASGMSEAAWLLEIASPEQRVACTDVDCWDGWTLDRGRVVEWVDALIEAGRPTLLKALREWDPELWLLALGGMADVAVVGKEEDPPDGWMTQDGVVYWGAHSDEDFARVREIAQASFAEDTARYWQLVYGLLFEQPPELEEYALKWHTARMGDLGFPDLEQAMEIYRPLSAESAPLLDVPEEDEEAAVVPAAPLPRQLGGTLLAEALEGLRGDRAAEVLGYVLGVANCVAVADGLRLSESESIPAATEKAVRGIDLGLRELAAARAMPVQDVLDRTRPADLFRIGVTLDDTLRRPPASERGEDAEAGVDESDES